MPAGFSSIAVRNAALLYEPWRKLPQIAKTVMPLASLMCLSGVGGHCIPAANAYHRLPIRLVPPLYWI
jgi:hypothetical protein